MDSEFKQGPGDAGPVARHAEEGGQPALRRRGQARRSRSATWSRTRSGRPATAWCWTRRTSRSCRAGPWSRTPPTRTGRTCAWRWSAAGRSRSRWTCTSRCSCRGPSVEPELFASLRPSTYSGAMERAERRQPHRTPAERQAAPRGARQQAGGRRQKRAPTARIRRQRADGPLRQANREEARGRSEPRQQSVSSAATAAKLGDFFQYAIDHPVTLPRQKSALLPIVDKDVEGTRVASTTSGTQAKFPLLGLKFKNTTGLHLMQGPITVFEGSTTPATPASSTCSPTRNACSATPSTWAPRSNPVEPESGRLTAVKVVTGHPVHDHQAAREARPTPSRTAPSRTAPS